MRTVRWTIVPVRGSQNPDLPDSHGHESEENEAPTIDRIVIPLMVSFLIATVVSVLDFVLIQGMVIQIHWLAIGPMLLAIGTAVKTLPRRRLVEAGMPDIKSTAYLQVASSQRLVTDGLYKHVRHPIYCGHILQMYGWVIMFSSLYGLLFVTIGFGFYLIRIRKEERMLVEAFGDEYREYQRATKKLIPYIY